VQPASRAPGLRDAVFWGMEGFGKEPRGGQARREPAAFRSQKNFGSRLARWKRPHRPRSSGIRSNTILPGFIDTPIFRGTGLTDEQIKEVFNQISKAVPCRRVGEPADIANCIRFLSSKEASYINGAAIVIDGGWLRAANWGI